MSKKSAIGQVSLIKTRPRKRPGRHSKRPNKSKRRKPYRGQGR